MLGLASALGRIPTPAEALQLFSTPLRCEPARKELAVLQQAQPLDLQVDGRLIKGYTWGQAGPAVFLAHGWNGQSGSLTAFVEPLLAAGFQVAAADAPAHGLSQGDHCYAPLFANVITTYSQALGGLKGLVAHSFGTCAATFALADGLPIPRVVFLSPMCWIKNRFYDFARSVGLNTQAQDEMWDITENYFGHGRIESYHGDQVAPRLDQTAALLAHDPDDREIPFAQAQALAKAWPGSTLLPTPGLGHFRILRAKEITAQTATFLAI